MKNKDHLDAAKIFLIFGILAFFIKGAGIFAFIMCSLFALYYYLTA